MKMENGKRTGKDKALEDINFNKNCGLLVQCTVSTLFYVNCIPFPVVPRL